MNFDPESTPANQAENSSESEKDQLLAKYTELLRLKKANPDDESILAQLQEVEDEIFINPDVEAMRQMDRAMQELDGSTEGDRPSEEISAVLENINARMDQEDIEEIEQSENKIREYQSRIFWKRMNTDRCLRDLQENIETLKGLNADRAEEFQSIWDRGNGFLEEFPTIADIAENPDDYPEADLKKMYETLRRENGTLVVALERIEDLLPKAELGTTEDWEEISKLGNEFAILYSVIENAIGDDEAELQKLRAMASEANQAMTELQNRQELGEEGGQIYDKSNTPKEKLEDAQRLLQETIAQMTELHEEKKLQAARKNVEESDGK